MLTITLISPFLGNFSYQEAEESAYHYLTLSSLIVLCTHFHMETTGGVFCRL